MAFSAKPVEPSGTTITMTVTFPECDHVWEPIDEAAVIAEALRTGEEQMVSVKCTKGCGMGCVFVASVRVVPDKPKGEG